MKKKIFTLILVIWVITPFAQNVENDYFSTIKSRFEAEYSDFEVNMLGSILVTTSDTRSEILGDIKYITKMDLSKMKEIYFTSNIGANGVKYSKLHLTFEGKYVLQYYQNLSKGTKAKLVSKGNKNYYVFTDKSDSEIDKIVKAFKLLSKLNGAKIE